MRSRSEAPRDAVDRVRRLTSPVFGSTVLHDENGNPAKADSRLSSVLQARCRNIFAFVFAGGRRG